MRRARKGRESAEGQRVEGLDSRWSSRPSSCARSAVTSDASQVRGTRRETPVNRRQLQEAAEQARRRAVELGDAGDAGGIGELIALCRHSGPTVRRAAASALGKLAGNKGIRDAVPALCDLTHDAQPQVRQYALVALARIGDEAALPACRDAANRSGGPDYVLSAALRATEQIETAAKARQSFGAVACSRCGMVTTDEERQLSERQFQ